MNKKDMPHLSKKTLDHKPAKLRKKWWFGIILIALVIGYIIWKNFLPQTNTTDAENIPVTTEQTEAVEPASMPVDAVANNATLDDSTDVSAITDNQIPDPEAILSAPLPETDSLAKEEIDRLEDEHKRLAEQEKLATEQISMVKNLTDLKAEEIELLEQQIAQIEADIAAKTSNK